MRMLQTLGQADCEPEFLRWSGMVIMGADGEPFVRHQPPESLSDQGWRTDYMFHQPDFESRLRGKLVTNPYVDEWLGWRSVSVEQDETQARVELYDRATESTQTISASFVVGCDGANSFVRGIIDPEIEDLDGTQRSLIVDVFAFERPSSLPPDSGFMMCRDDNPAIYVPIFPPMLRFEFMLRPGQPTEEWERPAKVYQLMSEWMEPDTYRIMRADAYEWHAYLPKGWRSGRLFVAGDAAHEMPPMVGQGMCSGLRDAANLAWKLGAVVAGGNDGLLDTYESERSPHVRPFIVESARQANIVESFNDPANRPPGFQTHTAERLRPPLGSGVADASSSLVGQLAPQPRTASGALLDDLVGYNFAVVGSADVIAAVPEVTRDIWHRLAATIVSEPDILAGTWLDRPDVDVAIIRPDRYVYAGTAGADALSTATAELGAWLSTAAQVGS